MLHDNDYTCSRWPPYAGNLSNKWVKPSLGTVRSRNIMQHLYIDKENFVN